MNYKASIIVYLEALRKVLYKFIAKLNSIELRKRDDDTLNKCIKIKPKCIV